MGGASVVVASGYTVACCAHDGWIRAGRQGIYDHDTRIVSRYGLLVDGQPPALVRADQPERDRWAAMLRVPRPGGDAAGPRLPQDALEVLVRRRVGPGLLDDVTVRLHSAEAYVGTLTVELGADFADVAEVDGHRQQRGTVTRTWDPGEEALELAYRVEHDGRVVERAARLRVMSAPSEPVVGEDGLSFELRLAPGGSASLMLAIDSRVDGGPWRVGLG